MSRGRSSSGGRGASSSGGSRGGSSWGGSRGSSSWSVRSRGWSAPSRTTIIVGGSRYYGGGTSSGSSSSSGSTGGTIFAIIICLVLAIPFLVLGVSTINKSSKYGSVDAIAVENTYIQPWYFTTYSYTVKGKDYLRQSTVGWEFPEVEGRTVTIYYKKNNPEIITEEAPPSAGIGWACLAGGGFAVFIAIGLTVNLIKSKKLQPASNSETNTSQPTQQVNITDDKVTCPYCGTKHNKDATSCPNCGAGRRS